MVTGKLVEERPSGAAPIGGQPRTRQRLYVGSIDATDMEVCGRCGQVCGLWRYRPGTDSAKDFPREFTQLCSCVKEHGQPWPLFDFNTAVHLCWCCGLDAVRSGIRWMTVLCPECHAMSREVHLRSGEFLVPIGRHSLMAGVGLGAPEIRRRNKKVSLDDFSSQLLGWGTRLQALAAWGERRCLSYLARFGISEDDCMPLTAYLAAAAELGLEKPAVFKELLREWGFRADAEAIPARR